MSTNGDSAQKTGPNPASESENFVKTHEGSKNDDFGFYFYPNRNPGKIAEQDDKFDLKKFGSNMMKGVHAKDHWKCKMLVKQSVLKYPVIQLMLKAMKAHGCPVDLERHIHCEPCRLKVSGGFDFTTDQVVICENNVRNEKTTANVLAHELLHAFDRCRTTMDFKNAEHVACTEIRAANLFHCSLTSAMAAGEAYPFAMKNRHQVSENRLHTCNEHYFSGEIFCTFVGDETDCVKKKALTSLLLVRNISQEEGVATVDRVFKRCYNDMEPLGRRIRKKTRDCERALSDGVMFGYTDT